MRLPSAEALTSSRVRICIRIVVMITANTIITIVIISSMFMKYSNASLDRPFAKSTVVVNLGRWSIYRISPNT